MSYNGKNYMKQGGDKWVIGGTLRNQGGGFCYRFARR